MLTRAKGLLGLAARGRLLASGQQAVEAALKAGQVRLLLVSSDAATATREDCQRLCRSRGTPMIIWPGSRRDLGAAIGRGERVVVAVLEDKLAKTLQRTLAVDQVTTGAQGGPG